MDITIKFDGIDEIERKLTAIADVKKAKTIARRGVRAGGKDHILPEVKKNAQSMVGGKTGARLRVASELKPWPAKYQKGGYGMGVQLDADFNEPFLHITKDGKRYYIPFAIEYGHAYPGRGGGSSPPKDVAPVPFMRKAYDSQKRPAVDKIIDTLWQEVKKVTK
ncbi:MAG: hypothetical protein GY841_08665 [FCB group bacterium]|nr:hypothetical protein [FCB group bacterium]